MLFVMDYWIRVKRINNDTAGGSPGSVECASKYLVNGLLHLHRLSILIFARRCWSSLLITIHEVSVQPIQTIVTSVDAGRT